MDNPIIPMNDFVNHPVEHGGSEVEVLDEALLDEPDHMDMGIKAPFNANPELHAAFGGRRRSWASCREARWWTRTVARATSSPTPASRTTALAEVVVPVKAQLETPTILW